MSSPRLVVLGTAQDGGIPHVGCHCDTCSRARANPRLRRAPTAMALLDPEKGTWTLIDATPAFPEQLERMARRLPEPRLMSSVVLSHAHVGHYTGLMYLGRETMGTRDVPVYAGPTVCAFLREHGPWKQLVELGNIELTVFADNMAFTPPGVADVRITPVPVPHRNEYSLTHGFLIEGPQRRVLYVSDIDRWEQWDRDIAEVATDVDLCFLDATFYDEHELESIGRSYDEVPHPLVTETMDRLEQVVASGRTAVYLTHLNHTNRSLRTGDSAFDEIRARGFKLAEEDSSFEL